MTAEERRTKAVELLREAYSRQMSGDLDGAIDHYELDYPNEKTLTNLEYNVKQDLHIGSKFEDTGGGAGQ